MANSELRVYLDHLIKRENLRYKRSEEKINLDSSNSQSSLSLRLSDLKIESEVKRLLRKPDFQRATWAWSPEDCVSLLESIVNEQVVPSIIMWSSPESGYDFILDGGHRVSVVMAWLNDDWGDKSSLDSAIDEEQIALIKKAADEVRKLVNSKIGNINEYIEAEAAIEKILEEGEFNPKQKLGSEIFNRGQFYRKLLKGSISFHRLWVKGDYEKAEASFLKINRSGQRLLEWETKLIENRNSSFARAIMSIANVNSASHYWPSRISDTNSNNPLLKQKVEEIKKGVEKLHLTLLKPTFQRPINSMTQSLLVAERHHRPAYIAELLTVLEGQRGLPAETEELLKKGKNNTPSELILSGYELINSSIESLSHLVGPSNNPKSLAIVPALYFYNDRGNHVRSLLYGFIYWLLSGSEQDILRRKRIFSTHRASFEAILLERKEDIASSLTRKSGSGSEITVQTASLFDRLISLLIKFEDKLDDKNFLSEYSNLISNFMPGKKKVNIKTIIPSNRRAFSSSQKTKLILNQLLRNSVKCGICNGTLDTTIGLQHDHILDFGKGGSTTYENQQLSHPFCNNNKDEILKLKSTNNPQVLPMFHSKGQPQQLKLNFFNDSSFQ